MLGHIDIEGTPAEIIRQKKKTVENTERERQTETDRDSDREEETDRDRQR